MHSFIRIIVALTGALLIFAIGAAANAAKADPETSIAADERFIDRASEDVDAGKSVDVAKLESDLRAIRKRSRAALSPIVAEIRSLERDRDQMGPAPAADAPPEDAALAARRKEIGGELAKRQAERTRLQANMDDAATVLSDLSRRRIALLYQSLGARSPSAADPALWSEAATGLATVNARAATYVSSWAERQRGKGPYGLALSLGALAASIAVSFLMVGPAHRVMKQRLERRLEKFEPTPSRRAALAGATMIARLLPGVIGGALVIAAARAVGFLPSDRLDLALSLWMALLAILVVEGLVSGLFSPAAPGWRIAPIDAAKGRAAGALFVAIVAAFALRVFAAQAGGAAGAPALERLAQAVTAVAIGILLVFLCQKQLWRRPVGPEGEARAEDAHPFWTAARRAGRWFGAAIAAAALIGYVRLADFAASRFYYVVLALALAWALRAALRELASWASRKLNQNGAAADDDQNSILQFWLGLAIDALLFCALLPLFLVLAGISAARVGDFAAQAFFGFKIGAITISFAQIIIAVALFFAGLTTTRLVQAGLSRGPFAHSRLDVGVQNSLTTLVGYVGLGVAALIGVTALGVNLSNLAIIAGALSVGVGFGLQSVVSNFVSGLILLFERPIKVGDWVVTQSGEGTVKKISVRSTEIETFERSSIIVPNSELISQTVTNWTHRDKLGRVTIAVGVAYGSDAEAVRDILLKCANDHADVLRFPEPFVVWTDFGASSLDFELRAFVGDIGKGLNVKTALRFAIYKAFADAGIEIPFPQQDVYIRSLPEAGSRARPSTHGAGAKKTNAIPEREPEEAGEIAPDD